MVNFCFYLYDRKGKCLFYREWNRVNKPTDYFDDQQIVHDFCSAITTCVTAAAPVKTSSFNIVKTATYQLHHYAASSGYRLILMTDINAGAIDISLQLRSAFESLFVEFVAKNPLWNNGDEITMENSPRFVSEVDKLFG
ncbi:hypothetical protein RCL1_006322 [Eukaryota sp. TZLM3-RCL]